MTEPELAFRVYPETPHSFYFVVNIWPTKKAMHEHCNWISGNFEAAASGQDSFIDGKRTKRIGEVNFHKGRLGGGIVAHEFLHATISWIGRFRIPDGFFDVKNNMASQVEEWMCLGLGKMVSQFWNKYYEFYGEGP